jgi:hypothetical protein
MGPKPLAHLFTKCSCQLAAVLLASLATTAGDYVPELTKEGGVKWALTLLFIIVVIMIARTSSTHCDTLLADGTYDRKGCE